MHAANRDLWQSCIEGNNDGVKRAIENGADLNSVGDLAAGGFTAIFYASFHGHISVIKLLVQHGVDVNFSKTDQQRTALHIACMNSRVESARVLLNLRANINALDSKGNSGLSFAVRENNYSLVRLLLQERACVRIGTDSILDVARREHKHIDMIELLFDAVQRQDASVLVDWMISLSSLELPICESALFVL
jgi:ankyrin repeat protein